MSNLEEILRIHQDTIGVQRDALADLAKLVIALQDRIQRLEELTLPIGEPVA